MVRGGLRGTRGSMRGGIRGPFKKQMFVPRHPFDLTLAEMAFPKVAPTPDDSALTNVSPQYLASQQLIIQQNAFLCYFFRLC